MNDLSLKEPLLSHTSPIKIIDENDRYSLDPNPSLPISGLSPDTESITASAATAVLCDALLHQAAVRIISASLNPHRFIRTVTTMIRDGKRDAAHLHILFVLDCPADELHALYSETSHDSG